MITFALILTLLFLILALTGVLGSVSLATFEVIGWILVALILLALIVKLLSRLFGPPMEWLAGRQKIRALRREIERREELGYDTSTLKSDLDESIRMLDPAHRKERARRRELGYDD